MSNKKKGCCGKGDEVKPRARGKSTANAVHAPPAGNEISGANAMSSRFVQDGFGQEPGKGFD